MALVKSKDTKPEILIRKALFSYGFRYRLHDKALPGKPDIVLPKYRTVILVHGCFWHRHSGCSAATIPKSNTEYWMSKFKKNVERDTAQQLELTDLGWHVIVVWECKMQKNFANVIALLLDELKS